MGLAISSGRQEIKLERQWRLAFAIRDASDASSFLLARSSPPQSSDELRQFSDSDIWELPCFDLAGLENQKNRSGNQELCSTIESGLQKLGMDDSTIDGIVLDIVSKVQELVGSPLKYSGMRKAILEPNFGPKRAFRTLIVVLETSRSATSSGTTQWFDAKHAMQLLVNETPHLERVGVLAASLFSQSFPLQDIKFEQEHQEYPPGILVMPMASRTLKPFCKTNLVLCAPASSEDIIASGDDDVFTADALMVDPGCSVPSQDQLVAIVKTLPKKLIVFVTHHHLDHTEGLPAIARTNPEAIVLAHEWTLQRMSSVLHGLECVAVTGGAKIVIRGRRFEIIDAPGHTDGHLCLFNVDTRTLVAGDHCVGEGSSILDGNSGGNLHDYLTTSHRLLELAPKVVVPMHGRPNLWPAQLLKGYIRHRQTREASVLKAIESGAVTAFDIVSSVYKQTPHSLWPAALLNVKSHVEHLESQRNLPAEFSVDRFKSSCGYKFMLRWFGQEIVSRVSPTGCSLLVIVASAAMIYVIKM